MLHAVRGFGEPSQTFVLDAIEEVAALGFDTWVAATTLADPDWFGYPPRGRLLIGENAPLRRRMLDRMAGRTEAARRASRLEAQARAVAPSVIHAHFGWSGSDVRLLAKRLHVPLVVSYHGTDATVFPGIKRFYLDYRRVFAGAARVTAVSRFVECRLRALGYDGPIERVPAGIRLDAVPYVGPVEDVAEARLLFVGRQIACKGLDVLLRAMPSLTSSVPGLRLDVIGDGPEMAAHMALARSLGVDRQVAFHGTQPRRRVLDMLGSTHVLVAPSRMLPNGQAEGSPIITKEALATGVPVAATRVGGLPETIPPQYRHELVPENDPQALGDRILALLSDRSDWQERSRAGRAWIEDEFDWQALARRLGRIYEDVIDAGARRGA